MFNLQRKTEALLQSLDNTIKDPFEMFKQVARDLPSLKLQKDTMKTTRMRNSMQSVQVDLCKHAGGAWHNFFLHNSDIVECLDRMGYRVDMVLFRVCGSHICLDFPLMLSTIVWTCGNDLS